MTADIMNEWDLQDWLTTQWSEGVLLDGERYFLAAWEVMFPSWQINDESKKWNEPSIDFLLLDRQGGLIALELKRMVTAPRDAWSVLCQVTHRAQQMRTSYSYDRLEEAYAAAFSGDHGRALESRPASSSLADAHASFFELERPLQPNDFNADEPGRIVAAWSFGESWPDISRQFHNESFENLCTFLESSYSFNKAREFERFVELTASDFRFQKPVHAVRVLTGLVTHS